MTVNIFFRKHALYRHSIEELFLDLVPFIVTDAQVIVTEVPYAGAGLSVIQKNLKFARAKKEQVNHITGDIHYLTLAFKGSSILTVHDVQSALKGNIAKQLYIKLFWFWLPAMFAKRITVISHFTRAELESIIPFAKKKIRVVYNPVKQHLTPVPYQFNTEKPQLLFVGTKSNKNLERSFEAIKGLACKAMIIGRLSDEQRQLLETYKIEYENKFDLTFEAVVDCYKACDFICFASIYEGFGMPIIEAQALGKPVLTSNFGAMAEVSNGSSCEVDPYDVNAIREGILRICENDTYRQQLVSAGLENVKRFRPEVVAKQYVQLYKEIIA